MAKATAMTTYFVKCRNQVEQRVTVPSSWKVTFGPISPGSKNYNENGRGGMCLRFYESANKQRACFTDVESFRDMGINVMEKVTKVEQQRAYRDTPEGRRDFTVEAHVSEWRNADEVVRPEPGMMALPKTAEQQAPDGGFDIVLDANPEKQAGDARVARRKRT